MGGQKMVVVVATLDTKGEEAAFVRDRIAKWGLGTILIDPGILGNSAVKADISRYEVAKAAGTTVEVLSTQGEKGVAISKQAEGLRSIVQDLYAQGRLDGIIGLGGGQGTSIATAAMRALPVGVPKLMLSTITRGESYVGTKDICMMHSVADIFGLNKINRPILTNAANAIAGMVLHDQPELQVKKSSIAITMLGVTTPCVKRVKQQLNELEYEVVPFHANGSGGPAMEELIESDQFVGVIDLNTREVIDQLNGGLFGAKNRLEVLTRYKIPAVVSIGGHDFIIFETIEKMPEKYQGRPIIIHNAQAMVVRPTPEEMCQAARAMIVPLNQALGPTLVVLPGKGISDLGSRIAGREMWQPAGNQAMIDVLQAELRPEVPVILVEAHVNDPEFADIMTDSMAQLIKGETPQDIAARFSRVPVRQKGKNL